MEYLAGRSLKALVREHGALAPAARSTSSSQVLRAARFAHKRGVIHRDLKPHNVILDEEGRAKVTDFGIARAGASDMTLTGSIMGTAQYLSPEQAQGHAVSGPPTCTRSASSSTSCSPARFPSTARPRSRSRSSRSRPSRARRACCNRASRRRWTRSCCGRSPRIRRSASPTPTSSSRRSSRRARRCRSAQVPRSPERSPARPSPPASPMRRRRALGRARPHRSRSPVRCCYRRPMGATIERPSARGCGQAPALAAVGKRPAARRRAGRAGPAARVL